MSNIFGWSYPAGAANDPNAPYNQDEGWTEDYCPTCLETYSEEWLAILAGGEEPPAPYPMCSDKCIVADEAEAADPLEWDW